MDILKQSTYALYVRSRYAQHVQLHDGERLHGNLAAIYGAGGNGGTVRIWIRHHHTRRRNDAVDVSTDPALQLLRGLGRWTRQWSRDQ